MVPSYVNFTLPSPDRCRPSGLYCLAPLVTDLCHLSPYYQTHRCARCHRFISSYSLKHCTASSLLGTAVPAGRLLLFKLTHRVGLLAAGGGGGGGTDHGVTPHPYHSHKVQHLQE